jgi:hypothetical protein
LFLCNPALPGAIILSTVRKQIALYEDSLILSFHNSEIQMFDICDSPHILWAFFKYLLTTQAQMIDSCITVDRIRCSRGQKSTDGKNQRMLGSFMSLA